MDKRVLRERMRRKRRQLLIRKISRLVTCVVAAVLVMVLVFKLIISPLAGKISGNDGTLVQVQAESVEVDPTAAVRMPIKDQNNADKATTLTAGWQEDSNGKWYQEADGTYYVNGLLEVDGNTYYVDENGYMQTGWVDVDGLDYMFEDNGIYNPNKQREMVALTFDDGPGKYTMDLLNCLEENDAKATFFMLGQNTSQWPDEVKKMQEIGCELGNHSYDHLALTGLDGNGITKEFTDTNEALEKICGSPATVARTPYGAQDENILSYIGMPCFMWDIDTLDWDTLNADSTYNTTMEQVSDGSIVLMHDIHETSVEAAKRLIPALIEKGYKLVTVSELARAKGVELKDGQSYTDFKAATVATLVGTSSTEDSGESLSDSNEDSSYDSDGSDSGSDSSEDSGEDSSEDTDSGSDSSEYTTE